MVIMLNVVNDNKTSACIVLKIGESYQNYLNVFILSSCHLKLHIIAKVVFPLRSGILFPLFYRITGTFRSCYHHDDCLPETIESFISCQSST